MGQAGLSFLDAQHVVSALLLNLPGNLSLPPHRIDRDHGASEIEHAEQLGQGRALVGF